MNSETHFAPPSVKPHLRLVPGCSTRLWVCVPRARHRSVQRGFLGETPQIAYAALRAAGL